MHRFPKMQKSNQERTNDEAADDGQVFGDKRGELDESEGSFSA